MHNTDRCIPHIIYIRDIPGYAALDEESLEEGGEAEEAVSPKVVGHNIYILCHQLAIYNKAGRNTSPRLCLTFSVFKR
jgi:hypothetical protein